MSLPASALVYTLLISLLVSALLGMALMGNALLARRMNAAYTQERAYDNLHSGLNHFLGSGLQPGDSLRGALPGLENDGYGVQSEPWGLWGLAHVWGSYGRVRVERSLLIGQTADVTFKTGLWLADRAAPLAIAGKFKAEGSLYLPAAGFRVAKQHGLRFEGKKPQPAQLLHSKPVLPPLGGWQIQAMRDSLEYIGRLLRQPENTSLEGLELRQAWQGPSLLLQSGGSLRLVSGKVAGKCALFCAGSIDVLPGTELQHPLAFARSIYIRKGFEGTLQAFATDSIVLEDSVSLHYPSVLYLLPEAGFPALLHIGRDCLVEGAVILDARSPDPSGHLRAQHQSLVKGTVYSQGSIDLRGTVQGTVMANEALLVLPAGTFPHYLLDLQIQKLEKTWPYPVWKPVSDFYPTQWLGPVVASFPTSTYEP